MKNFQHAHPITYTFTPIHQPAVRTARNRIPYNQPIAAPQLAAQTDWHVYISVHSSAVIKYRHRLTTGFWYYSMVLIWKRKKKYFSVKDRQTFVQNIYNNKIVEVCHSRKYFAQSLEQCDQWSRTYRFIGISVQMSKAFFHEFPIFRYLLYLFYT